LHYITVTVTKAATTHSYPITLYRYDSHGASWGYAF